MRPNLEGRPSTLVQVKGGCAAKMHFAVDAYLEEMKPWTTLCLGLCVGTSVPEPFWAQAESATSFGMLSLFGATCD